MYKSIIGLVLVGVVGTVGGILIMQYLSSRSADVPAASTPLGPGPGVPVKPPTVSSPATSPARGAGSTRPSTPWAGIPRGPAVNPLKSPARRVAVNPAPANPVITEPAARAALNLVGADPAANVVWQQAINDPSLTADDRKNLIEDLNEVGFSDPKNLTPDDLPLIESRLAIIETLAPGTMDDVNAADFDEAYKDLTDMRAQLAN